MEKKDKKAKGKNENEGFMSMDKLLSRKKKTRESQSVHKIVKKKRLVDANKQEGKKKSKLTFNDKEKSIEDFKKRTLKEIKRVQAKEGKNSLRGNYQGNKLGYVIGKTSDGKIGSPRISAKNNIAGQTKKGNMGSFFETF